MGHWEQAAQAIQKAVDLGNKWKAPFKWPALYTSLALAYHRLGKHKKEVPVYREAVDLLPDLAYMHRNQASNYLELGKIGQAESALGEMDRLGRQADWPPGQFSRWRGYYFNRAGRTDSAQVYFQAALASDSTDASNLNALAYHLIDHDIDVDRGVALAERAAALEPENSGFLDTYGWGLYRQGHLDRALEVLEKAYQLAIGVYYDLWQHLQAARKAVARGEEVTSRLTTQNCLDMAVSRA